MALFLLNPYQSLCFFWFVSGFVGDEIGAAMKNNYVLIDYENVQPKNLELLKDHEVSVKVFVGEKLAKVPFDLATAMQSLGDKAEYIKMGLPPNLWVKQVELTTAPTAWRLGAAAGSMDNSQHNGLLAEIPNKSSGSSDHAGDGIIS